MPGYHQFAYAPLAGTPFDGMLKEFVGVRHEIAAPLNEKPFRLPWLVVHLTEAGETINESGLHRVPQRPGSIVVMPRGIIHNDRVIKVPYRSRYILLVGCLADQFQAQFWQSGRLQVELYDAPPPAWKKLILDLVELLIEQPSGWSWQALARVGTLLDALLQQPPQRYPYADLLGRVQRLVESDTGNPWRLDDVAAAFRTDIKTLSRQFYRLVNQPPALWIRQQRMRLALKFLSQGMSVTTVSEQMGFSDPFCFSRQFKAIRGVSPSSVQARSPSLYRR
jgi:AraC-like DNA-binding protein